MRKVRTPQSTMLGNTQAKRFDGTVQQRAKRLNLGWGKGETVVQETTGTSGDWCGWANPIGSKTKQGIGSRLSPRVQ